MTSCSSASWASTSAPLLLGHLGEPLAVQDAHRGDGAHDGHLGVGQGEDSGGAERPAVHGDVRAAVGLAGDHA